jgi:anti-sigma B factor antagonist
VTESGGLSDVQLLELPIEIWRRFTAHLEAIQREFDIVKADLPRGSVPHRLSDLLEELDLRYAGISDPTRQQLYAAAERGESQVDLVYRVPLDVAGASKRLEEMLNAVDEFCRVGERLLTLATPPDLVAFRSWSLGEFTRQLERGLEPMPWSRFASDGQHPGAEEVSQSEKKDGEVVIRFQGDLDLASAGSLRNQILNARQSGSSHLTLDLSRVDLVDSVGISLLITAHARLSEEGGQMRLILPTSLRRIFEISGLIEILNPEFVDRPKETALVEES